MHTIIVIMLICRKRKPTFLG